MTIIMTLLEDVTKVVEEYGNFDLERGADLTVVCDGEGRNRVVAIYTTMNDAEKAIQRAYATL